MYRFETIDLGAYRGGDYFLTGFVEPEPADGEDYDPDEDADEYGIVPARSTGYGPDLEIVRMDTSLGPTWTASTCRPTPPGSGRSGSTGETPANG